MSAHDFDTFDLWQSRWQRWHHDEDLRAQSQAEDGHPDAGGAAHMEVTGDLETTGPIVT
ncbi:MAG: hypothetical protein U1F35_18425 [Steroidobacteraceae bacterium]|mgnify:CR=1 FL=1